MGIAAHTKLLPPFHEFDQRQHQVADKAIPADSIRADVGTGVGYETGRLQDDEHGLGPGRTSRVKEPADHLADLGQRLELGGARGFAG